MAYVGPFPIIVADGGTGASTLTNHSVLVGATTSAVTQLAVGTNGQVLVGSTAADPVFSTLTSTGGTITSTTGAGTLNLDVSGSNAALPAFLYVSGGVNNVTGNSVEYFLGSNAGEAYTKIFEQGSNISGGSGSNLTFTAPTTGIYLLTMSVTLFSGVGTSYLLFLKITTTLSTFGMFYGILQNGNVSGATYTLLVNMNATNTAIFSVQGNGNAANTTNITTQTYISGYKVA